MKATNPHKHTIYYKDWPRLLAMANHETVTRGGKVTPGNILDRVLSPVLDRFEKEIRKKVKK
jgi:acyl-CoA synthetase (NDP forming)